MARKRMISPEIWESDSFSSLSDFAKLVFIGLISNADDEGKGSAKPANVRSKLFPNDEDRRVTDIKKALSEIGCKMSITFYEVSGNSYYILTKWSKWQKIDRPTPSKLPNPPQSTVTVGERGRTTQNSDSLGYSTNTRRILDEDSSPNRIEKNRIPPLPPKGNGEGDLAKDRFFSAYPKLKALGRMKTDIDYDSLYLQFKNSEFLRSRFSAKWVCENIDSILNGEYADEQSAAEQARERDRWYEEKRRRAEERAEYYKAEASKNSRYKALESRYKALLIENAKAEALGAGTLKTAEIEVLKSEMGTLLADIGINEADLEPQYDCKKCKDTGFLPNGKPCNCYERR